MPRYDVSFSYREEVNETFCANSFADVERELLKKRGLQTWYDWLLEQLGY